MSESEGVPDQRRRSNRAAKKRSFASLDGGEQSDGEWSGGEEAGAGSRTQRGGGGEAPRRARAKKTPAIDNLEAAAREAEADVAALAPRAEKLRQRNEQLAAENAALKARVVELLSQAAHRDAAHVELLDEVRRLQQAPPGAQQVPQPEAALPSVGRGAVQLSQPAVPLPLPPQPS